MKVPDKSMSENGVLCTKLDVYIFIGALKFSYISNTIPLINQINVVHFLYKLNN